MTHLRSVMKASYLTYLQVASLVKLDWVREKLNNHACQHEDLDGAKVLDRNAIGDIKRNNISHLRNTTRPEVPSL